MDMKRIDTVEDMEKQLLSDKKKIDFALRQVVELVDMFGIAGVEQEVGNYKISIIHKEEE